MKREALFDGITDVREDLIEEAAKTPLKKALPLWKKWLSIAASLILVIGLIGVGMLLPKSLGGTYGTGMEGIETPDYLFYAGPVFPLTATDHAETLTATRTIDFNFSDYLKNERTLVSDNYILANPSAQAVTTTLLYPFSAKLLDDAALLPQILVEGANIDTRLFLGDVAGKWMGSSPNDGSLLNLWDPSSWEDYHTVLENDGYIDHALAPLPELDQPITVYHLTDYKLAGSAATTANPTLQLSFTIDPTRTQLLTFGTNGGRYDEKLGDYQLHIGDLTSSYRETFDSYLVFIGDDIDHCDVQGFSSGNCAQGTEMDISTSLVRREMTLGELIYELVDAYQHYDFLTEASLHKQVDRDLLYRAASEFLLNYSLLSETPARRYSYGPTRLEDLIQDAIGAERIMYLSFDVTIPAHASIQVQTTQAKEQSSNLTCHSDTPSDPANGYEMVTKLGSTLTFTNQTATLSGTDYIQIVDQNFGFDLNQRITEVPLDLAKEHYWLHVRMK